MSYPPPQVTVEKLPEHYEIINTFHPIFPAVNRYLEDKQGKNHRSISVEQEIPDILCRLPTELSAKVFSYLSPVGLDAACCVSRAWRMKIISDVHILSAVLESPPPLDQESPEDRHRRFLKELNASNTARLTYNHPHAWHVRFQERKLDFFIPAQYKHGHQDVEGYHSLFSSVKICDSGEFIAFLILDKTSKSSYVSNAETTLVFYHLGLFSDRPSYVGSIGSRGFDRYPPMTIPIIEDLTVIECGRGWLVKVYMQDHVSSYHIESQEAFMKDESPYTLRSLGFTGPQNSVLPNSQPEVKARQLQFMTQISNCLLPAGHEFLARLPPFLSGLLNAMELMICKYDKRNDLVVLRLPQGCQDDSNILYKQVAREAEMIGENRQTRILLLAPEEKYVFKNLAVTSCRVGQQLKIHSRHIVIAVIWQNPMSDVSELYHYKLPNHFDAATEIQGKRISSLSKEMGGIHLSSPLREPQERGYEAGLWGDLQIPSCIFQIEQTKKKIDLIAQKIIVRGPSHAIDDGSGISPRSIMLRVFDIAIAKSDEQVKPGQRPKPPRQVYRILRYPFACACPLHDDGFRIQLPSTRFKAAEKRSQPDNPFRPLKSWKITPSPPPPPPPSRISESIWPEEGRGWIEPHDSPARSEAIKREDEYLKDIIRRMKKMGYSEERIAREWSEQRITRYGEMRKPDGWKML